MAGAGAGGSSGHAGSGAVEGVVAGGTSRPCTTSSDTSDFHAFSCADLKALVVSNLVVGGDGFASPGQIVPLQLLLSDTTGKGFNWYPGVVLEADRLDVTFTFDDWRYAILACDSVPLKALATFAATVPIGTTVHASARPASLNAPCPDAPAFPFTVTVR
jgi:hypothetical protein